MHLFRGYSLAVKYRLPELSRRIAKRTEKAAYWVRRWSATQKRLYAAAANPWDSLELEGAMLHVLGWLHERNQAALKPPGILRLYMAKPEREDDRRKGEDRMFFSTLKD